MSLRNKARAKYIFEILIIIMATVSMKTETVVSLVNI